MPARAHVIKQNAEYEKLHPNEGAYGMRRSSEVSNASASQEPYVPYEPKSEAEQRLAALSSPFQEVTKATQNRLQGAARRMASRIDVWKPSSADFGTAADLGATGGVLSAGHRAASDIPFDQRFRDNPAHTATTMRMGEFWDPYAGLNQARATLAPKPKTPIPFDMAFGLGQTWKGKRTAPPDPAMDPANQTLKWIDNSSEVHVDTRRGLAAVLARCSEISKHLFKRLCACDGNGKTKTGTVSVNQFELCLRSVDVTATTSVLRVLLDSVSDPSGQRVDYMKFMTDLEARAKPSSSRSPMRSQTPNFSSYKDVRLKTPSHS